MDLETLLTPIFNYLQKVFDVWIPGLILLFILFCIGSALNLWERLFRKRQSEFPPAKSVSPAPAPSDESQIQESEKPQQVITTNSIARRTPSRFTALRGCSFQRVNDQKVRVWRMRRCDRCGNEAAVGAHDMSADDDELLSNGLIPWPGDLPPDGFHVTSEGPFWCANCNLVVIDEINRRRNSTKIS